jgi:hypothetical protein
VLLSNNSSKFDISNMQLLDKCMQFKTEFCLVSHWGMGGLRIPPSTHKCLKDEKTRYFCNPV